MMSFGRDEERQILLEHSAGDPLSHSRTITDSLKHHRVDVRGVMYTLFAAFSIFAISVSFARHKSSSNKDVVGNFVEMNPEKKTTSLSDHATWKCSGNVALPVLEGADMVSYFSLEDNAPAMFGSAEHESIYNGYRFWFVSEKNKALFEEEPLRYMPAWGGFCSWGIAKENVWSKEELGPFADPNSWIITDDGVLRMFRSKLPKIWFMLDLPRIIELGDDVWRDWWGDALPSSTRAGSPLNTACFCSIDTCKDA